MIYILIHDTQLKVFSGQLNVSYDLAQVIQDDVHDLANLQTAILQVIDGLTLPNNSRIRLILDHPFYEIKFVHFPYIVKANNLRKLITHAMGDEFLSDLKKLNFGYHEAVKKGASYYVVFAYDKDFSDKLFSILQDKGWSLQGVYPLSSWVFCSESEALKQALKAEEKTLEDDYLLLEVDTHLARVFSVKDGVLIQYRFISFNSAKNDDAKVNT